MHSESEDGGSDSNEEFENAANLDARRSRADSLGGDCDIALDNYEDDGPDYSDEDDEEEDDEDGAECYSAY